MSIYKLERCRECGYKRRETKPNKPGLCPECSSRLYYSKNWYFFYYLNGHKYEKVAGPNRKAAQEAEWKMKVDVAEGKAYIPTSWKSSVKELEETYRTLAPKSVEMYQNCVVKLTKAFGSMKLPDITEIHLRKYKAEQLKKGLSASSFNRDRSTLKRMFALSGVEWRFKKSAFTMEKETVRKRILGEEERGRLMNACKKVPYLYMAILVGLDTGFRKQSILALQWRDIDWKKNQVAKIGKGGKLSCVPLTSRLRQHLLSYRQRQKLLSSYVFPSPTDLSNPITDIRKSFQSACRSAGLSNVNLHDLRRSFATNIIMATKDITLASTLLGHADISTTKKHYSHLLDNHLREGVGMFEQYTTRAHNVRTQGLAD